MAWVYTNYINQIGIIVTITAIINRIIIMLVLNTKVTLINYQALTITTFIVNREKYLPLTCFNLSQWLEIRYPIKIIFIAET